MRCYSESRPILPLIGWVVAAITAWAGPSGAQAPTPWSVERTPILDISGISSTTTKEIIKFGQLAGAIRLSTGTIVIGDAGESTLHFYRPQAQAARSVGRPGDGPGEFRRIWWIGSCLEDSVFVWDLVRAAMVVFDGEGEYARETRAQPPFTISCSRKGILAVQPVARPLERG